MNALLILIPITLLLAGVAVGIFFWAVRHDQFEDLDTPKILPLLDEPPPGAKHSSSTHAGNEAGHVDAAVPDGPRVRGASPPHRPH